MTFSIVARCAETGMFGVGISSSSPAVAARCAFARAGVGAVATQNITDPRLGPLALSHMQRGMSAEAAIEEVRKFGRNIEFRQVLAIGPDGSAFVHSGEEVLGIFGHAIGTDVAAGGNLLENVNVPAAMVAAYEQSEGHIGDRILAALVAGRDAGGEAGPVHSAGIMLVDKQSWPYAELRCDWTEGCPIDNVKAAWDVYKPQADDYVTRALDPTVAPSYGVPGDE